MHLHTSASDCTLRPVRSRYYPFSPADYLHDSAATSVESALRFRSPLAYLGPKYANIVVPCTPAPEILCLAKEGSTNFSLIKVKAGEGVVKGKASGKRSAVLQDGDRLIRLKGCGMEDRGFIEKDNELKGSHFYHCVKRELLMTFQLNKLLTEVGLPVGNVPVGFFLYEDKDIHDQLPLIPKCCGVFQTAGDRRLGVHLIKPLEALLSTLLQGIQLGQINSGQEQFDLHVYDNTTPFLPQLLSRWALKSQTAAQVHSKLQSIASKLQSVRFDCAQRALKALSIQSCTPMREKVVQLASRLQSVGAEIRKAAAVFRRSGWEIGRIRRVFLQRGLNWGFYVDHGFLPHCNAHLNNFIVLPEGKNSLIAPIDFDLAFFREQFIDIEPGSDQYGRNNPAAFEQLITSENDALELAIQGQDIMTNFSYIQLAVEHSPGTTALLSLLRSEMLHGYGAGLLGEEPRAPAEHSAWVSAALALSLGFQT